MACRNVADMWTQKARGTWMFTETLHVHPLVMKFMSRTPQQTLADTVVLAHTHITTFT